MSIIAQIGAIVALALGAIATWKAQGAINRRKGAELQRQNDRIEDVDTAARIVVARADADGAADVDQLLDAQSAEARRLLVVPGTARDRGRGDPR